MNIDVTTRGTVAGDVKAHARDRIAQLEGHVRDRMLSARVVLAEEPNPRLERPSRAEAELNVNGHMVRGRVADVTMPQAVDQLAAHLQRQLQRYAERRATVHRRAPERSPHEWRHGDRSPPRPSFFPRPPGERSIIRRKTFTLGAINPLEAVGDLEDLDHDFYLFHDTETDADAVVFRRDDDRIGLIRPPATEPTSHGDDGPVEEASRITEPISVDTAVSEMAQLDHRFLFFTNAHTGRGNVIYMRYDGHYGLIEPAD